MQAIWRGDLAQRLRLISGLILFAFATTHFLNHAIGLISVDLMQEVREWRIAVTRSIPGTIVLAGALATHVLLALYKLARRTTLRMHRWELLQLLGGLLIPILLFPHIVNTRGAHLIYGVNDTYLYELLKLWPASAITQSLLLLGVWLHGCIGIHYWLRLHAPYRRLMPLLLAFAIFVPLAALGGFMVAGRGVNAVALDPEILAGIKKMTNWPADQIADEIAWLRTIVRGQYAALLGVVGIYAAWSYFERRFGPRVAVSYIGGPSVSVARGPTLLEISRMCRVPHASICGGRARCSTCRVRIERGSEPLAPPKYPESVTLASIRAPDNVRLACQLAPRGRLVVTRLLRPGSTGPLAADTQEADAGGVEKQLAVMFVDLREFTQLSEKRLPFDIVFILNEFFGAVGSAIADHNGRIDKFLGDGLLAVFGEREGIESGCLDALRTARSIDLVLDQINAQLEEDIGRPLKVGVGIDAGPLVLGRIGYGETVDVTVIGNPVNVASRLESLSKERGVQLVLSNAVAKHAKWTPAAEFTATVNVRGVAEPIEVIGIARGRDLPAKLLGLAEAEAGPKQGAGPTPAA